MRLELIAKLAAQKGAYTAVDCGCDHGKVLYKLLKANPDCRAAAIDKSAPSLDKARKLLGPFGDRVSYFCAEGIACLGEGLYDVLIISGIGGHNIIEILSGGKAKFNRLILSPHKDVDLVKKWLSKNNYTISKDTCILSKGKEYTILEAKLCQP